MKRKPNGSAEKAREAKGRFGRQVYINGARPYKRSSHDPPHGVHEGHVRGGETPSPETGGEGLA
jgi:hypothetical protein